MIYASEFTVHVPMDKNKDLSKPAINLFRSIATPEDFVLEGDLNRNEVAFDKFVDKIKKGSVPLKYFSATISGDLTADGVHTLQNLVRHCREPELCQVKAPFNISEAMLDIPCVHPCF